MKQFISLILLISALSGQYGKVSITIDDRLLKENDRQEISNLKEEIVRYYTGQIWNEDYQSLGISLYINFVVQGTAQKGGQKTFHAQALFTDGGDLRYFDKAVQFFYNPGGSLFFDPVIFEPLASFLSFYGYCIMGGQMDTYSFYGGTQAYEKARAIALRGQTSDYPKGWTERVKTLNEITDNRGLREARFAYYIAVDLFHQGKPDESLKEFQLMMKGLEQVFKNSPRGRTLYFLKAHADEITKLLALMGQEKMLIKLADMDPENKEIYSGKSKRKH